MAADDTIGNLLMCGAGESSAIGAPELRPLSYRALRELAGRTVEELNALGIGRDDRVAIVLGNGPEMAAAFVAIAAGATTAPVNPAYRDEEFEFHLRDLLPKALVVEAGAPSPARAVARRLGVPIVELHRQNDLGAGSFRLEPLAPMGGRPAAPGPAATDGVARVLPTSGTTSHPKKLPPT